MQRPLTSLPLPVLFTAVAASIALGSGCGARLTPERVRELLDAPTGTVGPDTMANATRDMFLSERATSLETFATLLKGDAGSDSSNALPGVSAGVLEDVGDVFCVGGLVASVVAFDACEIGDECRGELTLDSCLLRVGEAGDEDARGKIKLKLENVVEADFDRSTLGIEFDGWESTAGEDTLLDTFAGVIALESTRATDDSSIDLVFASDLDVNLKRKERGFFDDGIEEHTSFTAGLRFQAAETEESATGSLEVLAFADTDGGQDESLVVRLAADSHQINATAAVASASLEVIGENGTFACTWNASEVGQEGTPDGVKVTSAGDCVDEDGETFSFSGSAASN